ncbi:MAG: hypothetical protein ACOYMD_06395 [Paludibacter sp.]
MAKRLLASLIFNSLRRVGRVCPTTGGKAPAFQIIFEYGKTGVTCRLVGELSY